MKYEAGDVFLVAGKGFFSGLIRFFTRSPGEAPTKITHVGLVIRAGGDTAVVMEALGRGVTRRLFSQGPARGRHAVYRPPWTSEQIAVVVARAMEDEGKPYGWAGIVTSALDWCLAGAYVFRRLTDTERAGEFCSWALWDWCEPPFREASMKPFGKERGLAPDDVADYVEKHWECVRPLA